MVTYQGSSLRNYVKNMHQRTQTRNRMCKLFRGFRYPYRILGWDYVPDYYWLMLAQLLLLIYSIIANISLKAK